MKKNIYIIWLLSLIMIACSSDDTIDGDNFDNERIELSFQTNNFINGSSKSSTNDNTADEQTIEDLYVFLFPTNETQTLLKHYIPSTTFDGGAWDSNEGIISLTRTQSEVGNREVYLVANCSAIQSNLDAVASLDDLQSVLLSTTTPWSPSISTPILMSGNKTHNFIANHKLEDIMLIRTIAKVQLNIKLSLSHQATPVSAEDSIQYKYRFINFDNNTFVLKPTSKIDNSVSSSTWINWNDQATSYTLDSLSGKVTNLTLTTYLNERDSAEATIELSLPYTDGGVLPPPEFGNETYKLQLPTKIERNHWYIYDIEI